MRLTALRRDPDVAIDMGTDRTRLYAPGTAMVDAPTRDPASGRSFVSLGVVIDPEAASRFAERLISTGHRPGRRRARVVASCPLHVDVARARLVEALRGAGADEVEVIRSTVAAAAGAGLDVASRYAGMLVDVGAGLTEVAVFRDGALLHARTIPLGTRDLPTGSSQPGPDACRPETLAGHVARLWSVLPVDVQVEIIESGIVLTGGGAEIPAVVCAMRGVTRLAVRVPARPGQAVIRGLAHLALRTSRS